MSKIKIKKNITESYVWSVVLYSCVTTLEKYEI